MRESSKKRNRLPALLFTLPIMLAGIGLLAFGGRKVSLAWASSSWPSAPGRIISSGVTISTSQSTGKQGNTTSYSYHAEVSYSYTVDGVSLQGDTVAFSDYGSSSPSHAAGIVRRYPSGEQVNVFYKPGSPDQSVLEPGAKPQVFFLPALGLAIVAAGGALFVSLSKPDRRRRSRGRGTRDSQGATDGMPPEPGEQEQCP